jgi:hypothetical protein
MEMARLVAYRSPVNQTLAKNALRGRGGSQPHGYIVLDIWICSVTGITFSAGLPVPAVNGRLFGAPIGDD